MAKTDTSPAYLMYPGDILSSGRVSALKPLEELWYRRAMDFGWEHNGMPADPAEFAGWIGRGCTVKAAEKLIAIFYVPKRKDPSKVVNPRQEKERKLFEKKRKQKSEAGKRGMAKRWKDKASDDNSVITEDNIPIPISNTKKEELKTHTNTHASDPFPETVHEYPVKELIEAFPDYMPDRITPAMIGFLEAEVLPGDEVAWADTLKDYRMNFDPMISRYLPDKTANVLSLFRKKKQQFEERKNGTRNGSKSEHPNTKALSEWEAFANGG